jgi:predicted RNA-binding protein
MDCFIKKLPGKLINSSENGEPEMLIVEVQDDGVGREKSYGDEKQVGNNQGKSLGFKNNRPTGLKMLHSNSNAEGVIEYIDLYDSNKEANGTLVRIKIPVDSDN